MVLYLLFLFIFFPSTYPQTPLTHQPPVNISTSAPHLCLLLSEKGDRGAVDEERTPSLIDLPPSHLRSNFAPPPVGVGAPDDPQRPLSPTFRPRTLCLLLLEKGDRVAVDEECAPFPTDLSSSYRLSLPIRRGRRPRRPATPPFPPTFRLRTFAQIPAPTSTPSFRSPLPTLRKTFFNVKKRAHQPFGCARSSFILPFLYTAVFIPFPHRRGRPV